MHRYTVKDLKKYIEQMEEKYGNLDNVDVVIQRIEDKYFEKHNWKTTTLLFENGVNSEYIDVFQSHLKIQDKDKFYLALESHY